MMELTRRSFLKGLAALGVAVPTVPGWGRFQSWRQREFNSREKELKFDYFLNLGDPGDPDPYLRVSSFGVKATHVATRKQWGMYRFLAQVDVDGIRTLLGEDKRLPALWFRRFKRKVWAEPLGDYAHEFHDKIVHASFPRWKRWLM